MGGKVLVPTGTMIKNLKAARLAADIADVPLIILARTDANAAKLLLMIMMKMIKISLLVKDLQKVFIM